MAPLPAVRLLRLQQLLPQPLLYKPQFRVWVSVGVLPISSRVLWIRWLRALLSRIRIRTLRLSAVRRGIQGGKDRVWGGPAVARLSHVAVSLPDIQRVSAAKRATYRDAPHGSAGNNGSHTVGLRREGRDTHRAEECQGADPRGPNASYSRRRVEQTSVRPGYYHPQDFRQLDADERYASEPCAKPRANSSANFRGDRSTRHTDPANRRGSAAGPSGYLDSS